MITVGITTFKHRFEKYFKPLLNKIKEIDENIEVVVAVNGEHKENFDENYRKEILLYLSECKNTYPIMYTEFRSLAKLWNNILINSTNNSVLMLNDDISIDNPNFFNNLRNVINTNNNCFKINNTWSHVLLNRDIIEKLGWFDERLLGIGEEDGDMEWRILKNGFNIDNVQLNGINNIRDNSHKPKNIETHSNTKYSLFNRHIMYDIKYSLSELGERFGICPHKLVLVESELIQYPYERFYWENKNRL